MFLKELKNNKKILAKNYKSVYNTNGKGFNLCIESNTTGAISRYFCVECSL